MAAHGKLWEMPPRMFIREGAHPGNIPQYSSPHPSRDEPQLIPIVGENGSFYGFDADDSYEFDASWFADPQAPDSTLHGSQLASTGLAIDAFDGDLMSSAGCAAETAKVGCALCGEQAARESLTRELLLKRNLYSPARYTSNDFRADQPARVRKLASRFEAFQTRLWERLSNKSASGPFKLEMRMWARCFPEITDKHITKGSDSTRMAFSAMVAFAVALRTDVLDRGADPIAEMMEYTLNIPPSITLAMKGSGGIGIFQSGLVVTGDNYSQFCLAHAHILLASRNAHIIRQKFWQLTSTFYN